MKKNLIAGLTIVAMFLSSTQVLATTVEVEAVTPFSTLQPTETMKVVTREKVEFENGVVWESGTVVTGQVIDVKQPKRGKLNASFKFYPQSYTYKGKTTTNIDENFIAKYSDRRSLDKGQIAASAATTAGGMLFHIPFLSQGVSLAKGMVKNEDNNRLKSGLKQVYKDSPVSYVEEGKDIILKKDDIFYLKFKKTETQEDESSEETEIEPANDENIKNTTQITKPSEPAKTISIDNPEDVLKEVENAEK